MNAGRHCETTVDDERRGESSIAVSKYPGITGSYRNSKKTCQTRACKAEGRLMCLEENFGGASRHL